MSEKLKINLILELRKYVRDTMLLSIVSVSSVSLSLLLRMMELGNWQKLARNATSYIASANLLCIYLYYYARHICTFNMKHILGVNCGFFRIF